MNAADASYVGTWLARLPADQRLAAHAYTDARLLAWAAGLGIVILACAVTVRFDLLGALRRRIEAEKPRPWLTSATCAAALALILALAAAPVNAFTGLRMDAALGAQPGFAWHFVGALGGVLPAMTEAIVIAPPLYWLMRRLPRAWPFAAGSLLIVATLAAAWLPYALGQSPTATPAPRGPVRDGVAQLIAETGVPAHEIYATQTPGYDADVMGAFGQAKVILGPQLMAGPPAEARAYVGHLMSHYVHADLLIACLINGLVGLIGLVAIQRFAAPLTRALGDKALASAADPRTMPAAVILAALTLATASVAGEAYLRWANVRADEYSLDHAREPDGLAASLERFWDGRTSVDPNPAETVLFYPHPPLTARLAHIAAWKAAHPGR